MTPIRVQLATTDGQLTQVEVHDGKYAVLHALAALPERAIQALLNGQTIGLSTKPAAGIYPLPDDALLPNYMRSPSIVRRSLVEDDQVYPPRNPEFAGMWLRLLPRISAIECWLISVRTSQPDTGNPSSANPIRETTCTTAIVPLELTAYLQEEPLLREWSNWATRREALLESVPERFSPTEERPLRTPPTYRCVGRVSCNHVTTADALELLAWTTRRPIVGDAFRLVRVWYEPQRQYMPRMLLSDLLPYCWVRADESDYLLVRHRFYWDYQQYELPE
ncbi:MAG: hypothetical protein NZ550_00185, partial [Fimbriimonadales bacterium]|nr:hypothetical protein [Fimbriimonadales bacterium]